MCSATLVHSSNLAPASVGARRPRSRSFAAFLSAVLVSNLMGSAFIASAAWLIGSPKLPPWLPFANQSVVVGALVLGTAVGAWLAKRVDFGIGVASCSVIEAILALAPVGAVLMVRNSSGTAIAAAVVVGGGLVSFASGVTGPLWIAAVHTWPAAEGSSTSRIAREAATYQIAKVGGPVVAGAALGRLGETNALVLLGALNFASFLAVAGVIFLIARKSKFGSDSTPSTLSTPRVHTPRLRFFSRATALVGFLAIASDATRVYLPRLLQEAGMAPSLGGVVLACIAAGAAAAGLGAERVLKVLPTRRLMIAGFGAMLVSLALWWIGASISFWLIGAFLAGLGMSATYSSIVSMSLRGSLQPAKISGQIRVSKTLSGLLGTALIAACVSLSAPVLIFPVASAVAGSLAATWKIRADR